MSLEVTGVRIYPVEKEEDRLLSFASVVLEEEFVVHNLRLVRANSGLTVAMPNEEYRGEFRDIAHPISNDMRERIRKKVIQAYNDEVDGKNQVPEDDL